MNWQKKLKIGSQEVGLQKPTYFIADIAASHDGDLERAKMLIQKAHEAGAHAAKFQHFKAKHIVSDYGFKHLGAQLSHQATWKKSVYDSYKQYECNRTWTEELVKTAQDVGIDFFTSPYDYEAVDMLDPYLPAYKIGSGDITWHGILKKIAKKGKPVLLATGASSMEDVHAALATILEHNQEIVLMQCNTNYTGSLENFKYINLNVLKTFALKYPGMILGLSDHTPGHATVLGAIALGARVIEKHFTDDTKREGPDHAFSMDPLSWREMVERSRELEAALGDGVKRVEENEQTTVILQRRCVRIARDMQAGEVITEKDIEVLRPAPAESFKPYDLDKVIGKTLKHNKVFGAELALKDIGE